MDRFNSLDALVAESKKKFHMLIKFGSLENLERFQSGSLYHNFGNPIAAVSTIEYSDKSTFKFFLKPLLGQIASNR